MPFSPSAKESILLFGAPSCQPGSCRLVRAGGRSKGLKKKRWGGVGGGAIRGQATVLEGRLGGMGRPEKEGGPHPNMPVLRAASRCRPVAKGVADCLAPPPLHERKSYGQSDRLQGGGENPRCTVITAFLAAERRRRNSFALSSFPSLPGDLLGLLRPHPHPHPVCYPNRVHERERRTDRRTESNQVWIGFQKPKFLGCCPEGLPQTLLWELSWAPCCEGRSSRLLALLL